MPDTGLSSEWMSVISMTVPLRKVLLLYAHFTDKQTEAQEDEASKGNLE